MIATLSRALLVFVVACGGAPVPGPPPVAPARVSTTHVRRGDARRYDVEAELAWAQRRWPDALGGLQIGSPKARLDGWIPRGASVPVWVTAPAWRCARGALERRDSDDLIVKVLLHETATARDFELGLLDDEIVLGAVVGSEELGADGRWTVTRHAARSDARLGHLSDVTDDRIEYAGAWVDVEAALDCATCRDVVFAVTPHGAARGARACACGARGAASAELARVQVLLGAIRPWRVEAAGAVTIFRSEDACRSRGPAS